MVNGGAKRPKSEPLKVVIQEGTVGFYPINSLAVSALHHQQTACLIGQRDDQLAKQLKNQQELVVSDTTLAIQNKVYVGISDSFYRGSLPELLIVSPSMTAIPDFLEELLDFIEKLTVLGFISNRMDLEDSGALDKYIPKMAIGTYGIVYNVICRKLHDSLKAIGNFNERQIERILQRISRAQFTSLEEGYDLSLMPLQLFPKPLALSLAGPKSIYTVRATQLLEQFHLPCEFSPNGELGITEWELHQGYTHLVHRLLPMLDKHNADFKVHDRRLKKQFENIANKKGILPGLVTQVAEESKIDLSKYELSTTDLAIIFQLKTFADEAREIELSDTLAAMTSPVQQIIASEKSTARVGSE